jgi:hypothetical protein
VTIQQQTGISPILPAFITPNLLNFLVVNFNVGPITTVDADMKAMLGYNCYNQPFTNAPDGSSIGGVCAFLLLIYNKQR